MHKCPFNNSFRVSLFHVTRRELMQAESCQSPETAANVKGKMHSCVIVGSARVPFLLPAFPEDSTPQWPHVATTCPGLRCRSWAGGRREKRFGTVSATGRGGLPEVEGAVAFLPQSFLPKSKCETTQFSEISINPRYMGGWWHQKYSPGGCIR